MSNWYPQDKKELISLISSFLDIEKDPNIDFKKINGIIVPHAGYFYSGKIAGKAYSLLKMQNKKPAIIISPSHYVSLNGITSHNKPEWRTPLGKIKIIENNMAKTDISQEHAIDNQIPFLQKLGFKKILPIMIGEISIDEVKSIAKKLASLDGIFIFSTDLSHFLRYNDAIKKDNQTITAIKNLNSENLCKIQNSACGIFPLLIFIELARLKGWKPQLLEYKNSGDITGDKSAVVGYSSFYF